MGDILSDVRRELGEFVEIDPLLAAPNLASVAARSVPMGPVTGIAAVSIGINVKRREFAGLRLARPGNRRNKHSDVKPFDVKG